MLFNSFTFLLFFLFVLTLHSVPLPWGIRRFNLLLASYVFYAAWDVRFTLLLVFATVTNALAGALIARWDAFPGRRRITLWTDVVLNIGLLCVFKYGNNLLEAWSWFAGQLSGSHDTFHIRILLPVGLSFFTLQSLSYTIDVYRRDIAPTRSLLDFALFVAFFPVLLAGPLLRAGDFLSQCARPRRATLENLGYGAALITLGIFLKAVADAFLAPVVILVYAPDVQPNTHTAWIGTIAFAGQDYCDFAGYACCAVGIGACLGFTLPDNFRAPLASVGFRDLWQRWHITLVTWMRDYVFLSLGGVFKGYRRAAINVVVVFLLIGLWHGARWTYVVFGLLHATFLIVETTLQRSPLRHWRLWNTIPGTALLWATTMAFCCLAFTFYRAQDISHAWRVLNSMAGAVSTDSPFVIGDADAFVAVVVVESIIVAHWLRRQLSLKEVIARSPLWLVAICLAAMLVLITIITGESQEFLYFQF